MQLKIEKEWETATKEVRRCRGRNYRAGKSRRGVRCSQQAIDKNWYQNLSGPSMTTGNMVSSRQRKEQE